MVINQCGYVVGSAQAADKSASVSQKVSAFAPEPWSLPGPVPLHHWMYSLRQPQGALGMELCGDL